MWSTSEKSQPTTHFETEEVVGQAKNVKPLVITKPATFNSFCIRALKSVPSKLVLPMRLCRVWCGYMVPAIYSRLL